MYQIIYKNLQTSKKTQPYLTFHFLNKITFLGIPKLRRLQFSFSDCTTDHTGSNVTQKEQTFSAKKERNVSVAGLIWIFANFIDFLERCEA